MAMGLLNKRRRAAGLPNEQMEHIMATRKGIRKPRHGLHKKMVKFIKDSFKPCTLKGSKSSSNLSESL